MASRKIKPEDISVGLLAKVQRKQPNLPRFVIVPSQLLTDWGIKETTIVEGSLNGIDFGRRSLKRWDEQRWFIELPDTVCKKARVDTGHSVTLVMWLALNEMPAELTKLIADDPQAKSNWEKMTASQQRMLKEQVAAAIQPATRERRARLALSGK